MSNESQTLEVVVGAGWVGSYLPLGSSGLRRDTLRSWSRTWWTGSWLEDGRAPVEAGIHGFGTLTKIFYSGTGIRN